MENETIRRHPVYENYGADGSGAVFNMRTGHKLKTFRQRTGYYSVTIWDGKGTTRLLSRFVYECHNGLIPPHLICDHIDGDKSHNDIGNLRAITQSENLRNRVYVSKNVVRPILSRNIETGIETTYKSMSEAQKMLGIFPQRIKDVCNSITKSATSKVDACKYFFSYL